MSKFCELRGTTLYDLDLGYLTKMLGGSGAAIAALESNNGHNLDKAPNGQPSKLYLSLRLLVKELHPDISDEDLDKETLRLKLKVYSSEFIEWFGDWRKNQMFNTFSIDATRVDIEEVDKPWKNDPSESNKTLRIYLKDHSKGYFELVKDHEPGYYSVHLKTSNDTSSKEEHKILFEELVKAIPKGALVSTWGSISEDGIRGLYNVGRDMQKVGERTIKRKLDNSDINIPIFQNDNTNISKVVDENGEPLIVYTGVPVKDLKEFRLDVELRSSHTNFLKRGIYFTDKIYIAESYKRGKPKYHTTDLVDEEHAAEINSLYWSGELAPVLHDAVDTEDYKFAINDIGLSPEIIKDYVAKFTETEVTGELLAYEIPIGEIIPTFLSLKNPVQVQHNGTQIIYLSENDRARINSAESAIVHNVDERTIYDGPLPKTGTDYIVFDPNQIKSIYNEGEFSESRNIYHEPVYRNISTGGRDYRLIELFENSEDQREVSKLVEISLILNLLKENPEYSPVYNLLAKRHQEGRPNLLDGIKVVLESPIRAMYPSYFEKKYRGSRAYYDAKTKTIYINIDKGFNGKADATIWHELMHAMTIERLQDLTLLVIFNQILNKYLEAYPEYKTLYSGENGIEEFVADIWSDQGTIERLKSIKSDNVEKSLWDKIKEFVLSFFEISEKDTLFAEASIALDKLLDLKTFGRVKRQFFEPTSRNVQLWGRSVADPTLGYEVSSQGDTRFSALNAKFKIGTYIDGVNVTGKTIEEVYQTVIKKSAKGEAPDKTSKLHNTILKTKEEQEDFSYEIGYLPLWQEWARLNPELIQELRQKAKGKTLTDKFANTRVSQARALAQIINEMDAEDNPTYSSKVESAKEYWSRESVEKDPTSLYLFTDNTDRTSGTNPIAPTSKYALLYSDGRQLFYPGKTSAVIRGLDNAMPISTLKSYTTARGAAGNWTDDDLDIFTEVIEKELQAILKEWNTGKYERIVIPAGGLLGGRIANITLERTPLLYDRFYALMHKYGLDNIIPSNHESKVDIAVKNAIEQRFVVTGNADFVKGKVIELNARGIKAINTLRTQDNFHYGNPFTPLIVNGTIRKTNIKECVEAFEQWIRKEAYLDVNPVRRDEIIRQIEAGELDDAVLVYYTEYIPDKSYGEKFYDPIKAPNHAHILLRLIEESKIKRAEKNSSFLLKVEPNKKDGKKDLEVQLEQDIQDLLDLIEYLSKKQGLSSDEIKEKQRLFLNGDISAINFVESLLNKVYIRQAELHTLGFDYNEETRDKKGHFSWDYYLNSIDLNVTITEDNVYEKDKTTGEFILNPDGSYNSMFAVLEDYQIDPAEIIMPKLYKSLFKLGNYSLSEITEEFFLKSNPYYQSDLKRINEDGVITDKGKIDFLIRCHNYKFNIAVVDDITKAPAEGLRLVKTEVGESVDREYRLNSNGDRMYKVPENDSEYKIYKDSYGNETIVFSKENAEKNIKALISSLEKLDLVSIQAFLENLLPTKEWINYVINKNNIETNNSKLIALNRDINNLTEDQIRQELQNIYILDLIRYKKDLAGVYYNSFIKTLQAISVRIPTQAFLSIMAVKVVGLTNDSSNNVFVNRWQFWLLGSK